MLPCTVQHHEIYHIFFNKCWLTEPCSGCSRRKLRVDLTPILIQSTANRSTDSWCFRLALTDCVSSGSKFEGADEGIAREDATRKGFGGRSGCAHCRWGGWDTGLVALLFVHLHSNERASEP